MHVEADALTEAASDIADGLRADSDPARDLPIDEAASVQIGQQLDNGCVPLLRH